jgi:hypothetical protein
MAGPAPARTCAQQRILQRHHQRPRRSSTGFSAPPCLASGSRIAGAQDEHARDDGGLASSAIGHAAPRPRTRNTSRKMWPAFSASACDAGYPCRFDAVDRVVAQECHAGMPDMTDVRGGTSSGRGRPVRRRGALDSQSHAMQDAHFESAVSRVLCRRRLGPGGSLSGRVCSHVSEEPPFGLLRSRAPAASPDAGVSVSLLSLSLFVTYFAVWRFFFRGREQPSAQLPSRNAMARGDLLPRRGGFWATWGE